jgi:hypothetical protein
MFGDKIDRKGWTPDEELGAFVDIDEEMIFCPRCRSPEIYLVVEHKEYTNKGISGDLIKLTHDIQPHCARCGMDLGGWFLEDYIPKKEEEEPPVNFSHFENHRFVKQ